MEDCTESHQTWNEMLGEQSRSHVGTALQAALDPCAPSEPVPHSSGFVATSEHAVISGWSAGSFSPVQSIPRVDCVETHGFGGVESVTRAKLVFFSSGLAVTSEHAVVAVIPGFLLSHQLRCKANLASTVLSLMDLMWACLVGLVQKDTSPAHLARSQPGVGTQYAHVGCPGVELVSRVSYISRKKRNLETVQRHSNALKKAQRDAKRKFIAQPEISHEAADLILRNQAARTDEKFHGTTHVSHHLALLHGHENAFFLCTVWCTQRRWSFEATEVSVRRIWRIPPESETQA